MRRLSVTIPFLTREKARELGLRLVEEREREMTKLISTRVRVSLFVLSTTVVKVKREIRLLLLLYLLPLV